jgi:hypothetical protein
MLDDHDLIDGFGTYDDETQAAAVFSHIGARGYFVSSSDLYKNRADGVVVPHLPAFRLWYVSPKKPGSELTCQTRWTEQTPKSTLTP